MLLRHRSHLRCCVHGCTQKGKEKAQASASASSVPGSSSCTMCLIYFKKQCKLHSESPLLLASEGQPQDECVSYIYIYIYISISSTQHGMMHHDHAHNLHASNNALLANVCFIYVYICRYVRMHVCINNIYARIPRIVDKIDHLIYKPLAAEYKPHMDMYVSQQTSPPPHSHHGHCQGPVQAMTSLYVTSITESPWPPRPPRDQRPRQKAMFGPLQGKRAP